MGLEPMGVGEVKLFTFEVAELMPLDVEAIGSDSARGGCRSDLLEEPSGTLGLAVGE